MYIMTDTEYTIGIHNAESLFRHCDLRQTDAPRERETLKKEPYKHRPTHQNRPTPDMPGPRCLQSGVRTT